MSRDKIVLVVDDDYDFVSLISLILENAGYKVLQGYNGEDALNLAEEHQPDCILLDGLIPGPSGWEICRILKRQAWTEDIPVIMMTTFLGDLEIDHLPMFDDLTMTADSSIEKTSDSGKILRAVRSLIDG